jgi:hypothetical protein
MSNRFRLFVVAVTVAVLVVAVWWVQRLHALERPFNAPRWEYKVVAVPKGPTEQRLNKEAADG